MRPALELLQPRTQWLAGLLSGVKAAGPGRKHDYSFLSSAQDKNAWSHVFTPALFMTWCLVQRRDGIFFIILDRTYV
jgi:hypothetical protein